MLSRFQLTQHQTTVSREFWGGFSSFLASFYIIIVNPAILSHTGMPFSAVCTATILSAAFATILMGLYANNPIVLAPGMGLNAFFTFNVVMGNHIAPEIALGIVFWSGVIFILFSVLKIREKVLQLIPHHLRFAIAGGIGIFISFVGLVNAKVIVPHAETLVQMAPLNAQTLTFFVALLVCALLCAKNFRAAFVLSILLSSILAFPLGRWWGDTIVIEWQGLIALPDFSWLGKLNFTESISWSLLPTILAFMFTNLFDTVSTLVGVSEAGNILDAQGRPRHLEKSLLVDAFATVTSALVGSSPTTCYIESAAGVRQGARTGLSSIFAGLFFLPFLFFSPLLSMFPLYTTAPVLVMVGIFMLVPINKIDWKSFDMAFPSFLALLLIPLTFSITKGLVIALLAHHVLLITKKFRLPS